MAINLFKTPKIARFNLARPVNHPHTREMRLRADSWGSGGLGLSPVVPNLKVVKWHSRFIVITPGVYRAFKGWRKAAAFLDTFHKVGGAK